MTSVILDPAAGYALLGATRLSLHLNAPDGTLQINGDTGPILRPLNFLERSRLVAYAAASRSPCEALGSLIGKAALTRAGAAEPLIVAIVAMTMAGGSETDLPSYPEVMLMFSRTTGWTPDQLDGTEAREVDQMVRLLVPAEASDDGWTRLILAPDPGPADLASDGDLKALHDRLATNLLQRGSTRSTRPRALPVDDGADQIPAGSRTTVGKRSPDTQPGASGASELNYGKLQRALHHRQMVDRKQEGVRVSTTPSASLTGGETGGTPNTSRNAVVEAIPDLPSRETANAPRQGVNRHDQAPRARRQRQTAHPRISETRGEEQRLPHFRVFQPEPVSGGPTAASLPAQAHQRAGDSSARSAPPVSSSRPGHADLPSFPTPVRRADQSPRGGLTPTVVPRWRVVSTQTEGTGAKAAPARPGTTNTSRVTPRFPALGQAASQTPDIDDAVDGYSRPTSTPCPLPTPAYAPNLTRGACAGGKRNLGTDRPINEWAITGSGFPSPARPWSHRPGAATEAAGEHPINPFESNRPAWVEELQDLPVPAQVAASPPFWPWPTGLPGVNRTSAPKPQPTSLDLDVVVDELAARLHLEADLREIDR